LLLRFDMSVVEKVLQAREPEEVELLELWRETLDRESQDWLQRRFFGVKREEWHAPQR
jgi:hypothetical protein